MAHRFAFVWLSVMVTFPACSDDAPGPEGVAGEQVAELRCAGVGGGESSTVFRAGDRVYVDFDTLDGSGVNAGRLTAAAVERFVSAEQDVAEFPPEDDRSCIEVDGCTMVVTLGEADASYCPRSPGVLVDVDELISGIVDGLRGCDANAWIEPDGDCRAL